MTSLLVKNPDVNKEAMISCAEREGSWEGTVTEQFDQTSFLCAGADWAEDLPVGRILAWRLCR